MSVEINTVPIQYKGTDGNYIIANAFTTQPLETYVNQIEAAAAEAEQNIQTLGANSTQLLKVFSDTQSYKMGEYVLHQVAVGEPYKIYRARADLPATLTDPIPWSFRHWEEISDIGQLGAIGARRKNLFDKNSDFSQTKTTGIVRSSPNGSAQFTEDGYTIDGTDINRGLLYYVKFSDATCLMYRAINAANAPIPARLKAGTYTLSARVWMVDNYQASESSPYSLRENSNKIYASIGLTHSVLTPLTTERNGTEICPNDTTSEDGPIRFVGYLKHTATLTADEPWAIRIEPAYESNIGTIIDQIQLEVGDKATDYEDEPVLTAVDEYVRNEIEDIKLNCTMLNDDVSDIKNAFVQSTKDAFKYIHGVSGITWENGTLDSSGIFGSSDRSIVSSFIDLHNQNLYICLPEDGTITARTYYYSDSTESSFGVRGTAKTASNVSTNGTYRYCRVLLYYTSSAAPRDDDLSKKAFLLFGHADNYRGKIGQLDVTAFSDCTDEGYYSFVAGDLTNLSDVPSELTTGGILFTYSHFGSFTLYQAIYDTRGDKYIRYGAGPFVRVGDSQADFVIEPIFEVGAITSSTGLNASSTKRVRMISTIEIKGGFSLTIPTGMKAELITYTSGTVAEENRGETSFGFLTEGTYLIYPRYGETHFRIYGGYTDDRTITDATVGAQFKMTYFDNAESPKWLALGDSITQGFYSYNNGSADTFGRTLNCWAGIAANKANLRLVNYGVGGSGYVEDGTVLDMKNAKDHVTEVDFSDFDCVTLAWGVNDWKGNQNVGSVDSVSGDGTICGNMKYVIETILASNPIIKIFVVTPLNCAGYSKNYGTKATNWGLGYSFTNSGTLESVYQAEKAIAEYYGLQLIDQTHQSAVNRENLLTVLVDGVHPSMDCHAALGAEMAGKITFR